ncbi:hypothetical protein KCA24_33645, partial [Escherichia coli]|nr:hypothetical protein [Escherichia coli]
KNPFLSGAFKKKPGEKKKGGNGTKGNAHGVPFTRAKDCWNCPENVSSNNGNPGETDSSGNNVFSANQGKHAISIRSKS